MRKPRVIIYDDDTIILDMLGRFFVKRGYEVYSYNEPVVCPLDEGLADSCANLSPCADVMISDFQMPKMTGIELFQRQAERGCRLDIKMKAIMSGYAGEDLASQYKDLGCSFFQKPFSMPALSVWLSERERHFDLSQQLNDRRANSRYEFKQDIEYCLHSASSQKKFIGITFDKSDDGLGIRIFKPLLIGEKILITKGLEVTHQTGDVKWCSKKGENIYRAGLRLL
jgi:CheY-like chemotaxis protein